MPEVRPTFETVLNNVSSKMISDLEEVRQMLSHGGSKGSALEDSVAGLLRRFLPDQFLVTSGFAVDASGKLSPQQDVLIVLNDRLGPLSTYGGFGVFPIENVFASIEVKAQLTVENLRSSIESLRALRNLAPRVPGRSEISSAPGNLLRQNVPICGPFTGVFAFSADGLSAGRILHECQQAVSEIYDRQNVVYVLGHSVTTWLQRDDGVAAPALVVDPQAVDPPTSKKWEARALTLGTTVVDEGAGLRTFQALLLGFVNWYRPPELDLNARFLQGISLPYDVAPRPPWGPA